MREVPSHLAGRFRGAGSLFRGPVADHGPGASASDLLPAWFYVLYATGCAVFLVMPSLPVRLLLLGGFWVAYFWTLLTAPRRAIYLFLLGPITLTLAPGLSLRLFRGFNSLTVFLATLIAVAYLQRSEEPAALRTNRCLRPTMFLVLLLAASTAHAYFAGTALKWSWIDWSWSPAGAFAQLIVLKDRVSYLLVLPIAFRLIRGLPGLGQALRLCAIAMLLESAHQILTVAGPILRAGDLSVRAEGLVSQEPNGFGGFLAMSIVIMLPVLFDGKPAPVDRVLLSAAIAAGGVALLLTLSRGAWLACLAGLLSYGLIRRSKVIVVLLLLALTATIWLPDAAIERARITFNEQRTVELSFGTEDPLEASAQRRIEIWRALPSMFLDAPLFGHGHGSFMYYYYTEFRPRTPIAPHSTVVGLLVEQGLLGAIAYVWLLGSLGHAGWRVLRGNPDPRLRVLGGAFVAGLICFVIRDATISFLNGGSALLILWVLGGGLVRESVRQTAEVAATAYPGAGPSVARAR